MPDYEFFAKHCQVADKHKLLKEFKLNPFQKWMLERIEDCIKEGKPVRLYVIKGRVPRR